MKKIVLLGILIFAALFYITSNNQTAKDVDRMDAEYFKPAETIFLEAFDNDILKRIGTDADYKDYITNEKSYIITNKYLPAVKTLNDKFSKEKSNSSIEKLETSLKNMLQSLLNVMEQSENIVDNKALDEAFIRLISDYYQCQNEFSLIKNEKTSYELNVRNFQQIKQGDTYFDVVNKFKMPGALRSSRQYRDFFKGNIVETSYVWDNGKGIVFIDFKNGKVDNMSQIGLE